jgi:hypothetical protein
MSVPRVNLDHDFCLILAGFGQSEQAFLETDPGEATFERAVADIIEGQVDHVLASFNSTRLKDRRAM